MHDPFQIHPALGAYSGFATPFQSLYSSLNPVAGLNPLAAAYPPIASLIPQLQLAQILAARAAVPWGVGLQNPGLENPLLAQTPFGAQHNPYNPYNPYMGQTGQQFGQIGSPYGQIAPMLAPQSWVGQQGLYGGNPLGQQVHPLISQLLARGIQPGMFGTGF